jgi:uncharacterized protein YaaR (DUF327 family)
MANIDPSGLGSLFTNPLAYLNARSEKTRAREKERVRGPLFQNLLETQETEEGLEALRDLPVSEETVQALLGEVRSTGDDLKNHPHPDEIVRYKKAVRNFMNYVVENGYELAEIEGIKKKVKRGPETEWKQTIFRQIRVVDEKLEKLAAEILAGQTVQLGIIGRLEEINGLLVDMIQ